MTEILSSFLVTSLFQLVLFPVGSFLLLVALKWVTQNDRYARFRKEDFAMGLDLMLLAVMMTALVTVGRANDVQEANAALTELASTGVTGPPLEELSAAARVALDGIVAGLLTFIPLSMGIWGVSTIVRKWGWADPENPELLRVWRGISLPLLAGIGSLVLVMLVAQ